jgi:hypothetical protein
MSRIDASTTAVLVSNVPTIQLYKYEPFSNSFAVKPAFRTTDTLNSSSTGADIVGYVSNVSSTYISFSSSTGPNASVSNVTLTINDVSGGITQETLTYKVNIGAGRFTQPIPETPYTLYRNEPAFYNENLAAKTFVASIPITQPVSTPALPTGLTFVGSGTTYDLSGTPILQSPGRDYTIIGRGSTDPSKVVTVKIRLSVGAERMVVDLSGSKSITGMTVGSPIVAHALFSRCPPYPLAGSNVVYAWSALPEGLYFTNATGSVVSSPYTATDASSTLVLKGTPTLNAARTITVPFNTNVTATRKSLPAISSNVQYSFGFNETVLFDSLGVFSNQYAKASVKLSNFSNRFYAYTRFAATDVSISDISNTTPFPTGLALSFTSNKSEAYVVGTPSNASSNTYTIRASNANGVTGFISFDLAVVDDFVTFTSSDICAAFITDRALSNAKEGYYEYPIQFTAVSAAGCNVTYTAAGLPSGITMSTAGLLMGTPAVSSGLTSYIVTATAAVTGASNTKSFLAQVLPETFKWTSNTLSFVQNIPITSVQFRATTLSERPVVAYSSTTQPYGLSFSSTGKLTGTPLRNGSGTITVRGTTGLVADTCGFPFTVQQDTIVLYTPQQQYPLVVGQAVNVPVQSVAYSGNVVSNFQFSNLDPSYGIVINSTTGVISGTVTSNVLYIADCNAFTAKGFVNDASGLLDTRIKTTDPFRLRYFAGMLGGDGNFETRYTDFDLTQWNASPRVTASNSGGGNDFQIANGVFMTPIASTGELYRSTNGNSFSNVLGSNITGFPCISATVNKTGTDTWWGVGVREFATRDYNAVLYTSTDNGITWDIDAAPQISNLTSRFQTRDSNTSNTANISNVTNVQTNAYLRAGAAIAYKNGVLLVGGLSNASSNQASVLRSTDFGINWTDVTTAFAKETAFISTDHSNVWVMTGSDLYESGDVSGDDTFTTSTNTIKYSTDQGATWSNAAGGFNMNGYNITYASNVWVATGLDCVDVSGRHSYAPAARVSANGSNWSLVDVPVPDYTDTYRYVPPLPFSPFCFDGSWNTMALHQNDRDIVLCTHGTDTTSFADRNSWRYTTMLTSRFASNSQFTYLTNPVYATPSTPSAILEFPKVGAGPTIITPESYYTLYQFVTITPLVFAASDPTTTFFVYNLPVGLSFNPVTNTLSGTPSQLGAASFQVTALGSSRGITTLTVTINVVIPRVIRVQSGAGGFTSLLRQYVEVNSAQNSRDRKVLPGEPLGEFMAPPAPDNISDIICCPQN